MEGKKKQNENRDLLAPITMTSGQTNRHFSEIGNLLALKSIQISLNGGAGIF